MDTTRREFMVVGITSLTALNPGGIGVSQQISEADGIVADDFQPLADLVGPIDARPSPGDEFFDDKPVYAYRYTATDTGERSYRVQGEAGWTELGTHLKRFETTDLPTDVPEGYIAHDSQRGTPAWWDGSGYEFATFVDDVLTSPVTVANTTARTQVFNPDINANSLIKGRTYQIDLMGKFSTVNTSDSFTIDINLAGATDLAGIGNVGGNVTDAPWSVEFTFTVREHGQNGTIQPHTRGLFNSEPADSHHNAVAVDTTTVTELSVDFQWDAADTDNSVTLGQAHLKQMG